jgi:Leucine-rich repeat (LRR) protein
MDTDDVPEFVIQAAGIVWRALDRSFRVLNLSGHNLNNHHIDIIANDVEPLVSKSSANCISSIWEVDLRSNSLLQLPVCLSYLSRTERLYLSQNTIQVFDTNRLTQMSLLKILTVDRNQIRSIDNLHQLPVHSLKVLDLQFNLIESLPSSIGALTQLVRLNVSNNKLKRIPKEIGQCTMLNELYLNNNELQFLPQEIEKCVNLRVFRLEENKFEEQDKQELGSHFRFLQPIRLVEFALRWIAQHISVDDPKLKGLPRSLLNTLTTDQKVCRNCTKPFFTGHVQCIAPGKVTRCQHQDVPVMYVVCSAPCALALGAWLPVVLQNI